ncbi:unnamed protein product [Rangifer tarandus platyrhynchus]|uniref:Uncharacterized protein n=2 Tax=Rangifer tarandus platyrhynchus TaxID=3082113 RepID=A0ACB0F6J9_RANTA|nr:unnamed protein product [Rangifer tarandus platyrhynchus]CAI9708123.1 unnamed protein product [Rangifer tarandus platyrhynchus]
MPPSPRAFRAARVFWIQGALLRETSVSAPPAPPPGSRAGPGASLPPTPAPAPCPSLPAWGVPLPPRSQTLPSSPGAGILGGAAAPPGRPPRRISEAGAAPGPRGARPDAAGAAAPEPLVRHTPRRKRGRGGPVPGTTRAHGAA